MGDKRSVSDLLEFNYDFKGLVEFSCNIGSMTINLLYGERSPEIEKYEIRGTTKDIVHLRNKVIEKTRTALVGTKLTWHYEPLNK